LTKASPSRKSARRKAGAILSQSRKRQESIKIEQKLAQNALTEKTARLRKLRLAKESVEASPSKARKVRRSKQT
jgi:hypothetical protein